MTAKKRKNERGVGEPALFFLLDKVVKAFKLREIESSVWYTRPPGVLGHLAC